MNKKINVGIVSAVVFSLLNFGVANATITSSLDLGSRGSKVTELQTYLATNASIYPERLITGYFGMLTQAAVQRFQVAQGIVSSGTPATTGYGRVGPTTMARINALNGGVSQQSLDAVPFLSTPSVSVTSNSVTISWTSNEATIGQIYYDTAPLRADEQTGPNQQPFVSGTQIVEGGGYRVIHSVTIQNLLPNTTYYFLTRGVDTGANMSTTLPNSFRTSS